MLNMKHTDVLLWNINVSFSLTFYLASSNGAIFVLMKLRQGQTLKMVHSSLINLL